MSHRRLLGWALTMALLPAAGLWPASARAASDSPAASTARAATPAPPPARGVAIDLGEVFDLVGRFRYEHAFAPDLHVGAILGAGSPSRSLLERFNVLELGAHATWFALGDRRLGAGPTAQLVWRGGWGSRSANFGFDGSIPAADVRSDVLTADAGLNFRVAARSGLYAELHWIVGVYHGVSRAESGDVTERDARTYARTRVAAWVGWIF
ncbi:MAG: hypothetical protein RIT45_2939 [Pseudomonadota bacterium]|jgi:hypothetical protein